MSEFEKLWLSFTEPSPEIRNNKEAKSVYKTMLNYYSEIGDILKKRNGEISQLSSELSAVKKEYKLFVNHHEDFYKFIQEISSDPKHLGMNYGDVAILIINQLQEENKDLKNKLYEIKQCVPHINDKVSELRKLKARLKEAESVIDAVYNVDTMQMDKDEYDFKLESQEVFRITGEYKQKNKRENKK